MHYQLGTLLLEDILYFKSTVFYSRFQLTKNPDVSIATKSLPLYSKPKEQLIKQKNKIASNQTIKRRQHQSLIKENKSIYLCTQQKKRKNLPTPEKSLILGSWRVGWIIDMRYLTMV